MSGIQFLPFSLSFPVEAEMRVQAFLRGPEIFS